MATIPTALMKRPPTPGWDKVTKEADQALELRSGPRAAMSDLRKGDPIDRLPPAAARKLRKLQEEHDELLLLNDAAFETHQQLMQDRMAAKRRVDLLTDPNAAARSGDGAFYTEDHPSVVQARAEYDRINALLETLQRQQKDRSARRNAVGNLLRNVEAYLHSSVAALSPFEMDPPEVAASELPATSIERLRRKRRELLIDLKAVATAPFHSSVAKAKLRRQIEELAARGVPDVFNLIEGGKEVRFAQAETTLPVFGFVPDEDGPSPIMARAGGSIPDAIAFQIWLHKDEVIAKLEREVDEGADDEAALSDEQRAERTDELRGELLSVEREEEAFTDLAAGAILRRADLDPRAFLGVAGPEPKGN